MSQPAPKFMEIFHSKPSMSECYFLEKLPSGTFTKPSPCNTLQDASAVRPGFRVMRRRATRVEFVLTDGSDRNWENNNGANYVLDAVPGRYVVEHGIRRVGDADDTLCTQAVLRSEDKYIHVCFRADLWNRCYTSFAKNGSSDWTPAPGVEMSLVKHTDGRDGRNFELVIQARQLAVAFNDGGEVWDANNASNYLIGLPGRYVVSDGVVTYMSPTDKDLQNDPDGTPLPTVAELAPAKAADPIEEKKPLPTGTTTTTSAAARGVKTAAPPVTDKVTAAIG